MEVHTLFGMMSITLNGLEYEKIAKIPVHHTGSIQQK